MHDPAKGLILFGSVLVAAGLLLLFFPKVPFLGRLPGDIVIKRENFTLSFPLATSVVVSLLLSILHSLFGKLR